MLWQGNLCKDEKVRSLYLAYCRSNWCWNRSLRHNPSNVCCHDYSTGANITTYQTTTVLIIPVFSTSEPERLSTARCYYFAAIHNLQDFILTPKECDYHVCNIEPPLLLVGICSIIHKSANGNSVLAPEITGRPVVCARGRKLSPGNEGVFLWRANLQQRWLLSSINSFVHLFSL